MASADPWKASRAARSVCGTSDKPKVPHTLRAARDAFQGSALARETLGQEVVDHYTNMADVELLAFESAVTDWELRRGFERM